jgi:hypothetical protein
MQEMIKQSFLCVCLICGVFFLVKSNCEISIKYIIGLIFLSIYANITYMRGN